jgi:hypothetical protein
MKSLLLARVPDGIAKMNQEETVAEVLARPRCSQCEAYYDWHENGFALRHYGCSRTPEEAFTFSFQLASHVGGNPFFPPISQSGKGNPLHPDFDPFSDEAMGPRRESDVEFCARMDADLRATDATPHAGRRSP